ncbi:GIN domain-containing protein [Facilibium subflavum]|uniref:GIN domain-containing protein n=1 Tax=Facilibium subflavum TaxID=2219058 RepID=UPI000E6559DF|nr:DUF2807 domain-containing protein [Facilibium subflavum]
MKKSIMVAGVLLISTQRINAMTKSVSDYHCLKLDGHFNLAWTQGKAQVQTNQQDFKELTLTQNKNCLVIQQNHKSFWEKNKSITINLSSSTLDKISFDGNIHYRFAPIWAKQFSFDNQGKASGLFSAITTDTATLQSKGNDDLMISGLYANIANISLLGKSTAFISGQVQNISLNNKGKSQLNFTELSSGNFDLTNMGKLTLSSDVNSTFNITNMGAAQIQYAGFAKLNKSNLGALKVKHIG